jgi:fluoroquinolone transport system permease protein
MKRLIAALGGDMRYQWRYGFYFIYIFMTAAFIGVIRLLPTEWRQTALALTLLSDPALLGFFFIGGILQLERGEGLLDALFLSPLRPHEYLVSKALSLGLISAAAGCLIALGSGVRGVSYALLLSAIFVSSICFTFFGVAVSINLRSINAFLSIDGLWEAVLLLPPMLLVFGVNFALLEAFPGSIALRLMQASAGSGTPFAGSFIVLVLWTAAAFYLAHRRLTAAVSRLGGAAA